MSTPFLAEMRIMSFNFAPKGWAMCNGQFLPINQNQALFALLGTTYGGNGQTTFALPDMRGRVPLHFGQSFTLGQNGGEASHTVNQSELPAHNHPVNAKQANGTTPIAVGNVLGAANNLYAAPSGLTTLTPQTVGNAGGSQPHENRQPYLVLNFII